MLLLRNLAYNSSSQHSQQQGGVGGGAGAAGGGTGRGCSLQSWSGGEVLPAVKRALERPNPSPAVSAACRVLALLLRLSASHCTG